MRRSFVYATIIVGAYLAVYLWVTFASAANYETYGGTPINCNRLSAVDGDTIKCDGVNMRDMGDGAPFISGYDTPELNKPNSRTCPFEKALAKKARSRMAQLLKTPGLKIYNSGEVDNTQSHRPLVWAILPDGRSIGSVLIEEGLARVWTPDYRANWCASA